MIKHAYFSCLPTPPGVVLWQHNLYLAPLQGRRIGTDTGCAGFRRVERTVHNVKNTFMDSWNCARVCAGINVQHVGESRCFIHEVLLLPADCINETTAIGSGTSWDVGGVYSVARSQLCVHDDAPWVVYGCLQLLFSRAPDALTHVGTQSLSFAGCTFLWKSAAVRK